MSLEQLRSEQARARSNRRADPLAPTQRRLWNPAESELMLVEPMWLSRLGRLLDLHRSPERLTLVPALSKPTTKWPWERVLRRRLLAQGMTLEMLAERIDEPLPRLRLLLHFEHLWKSLEPKMSRALSTTTFTLSSEIDREKKFLAEQRAQRQSEQAAHQAARARLLQRRRERPDERSPHPTR
jgi:hypothetical protein